MRRFVLALAAAAALAGCASLGPQPSAHLTSNVQPLQQCAQYHMFFPTPRASPVSSADDDVEFMFSPQALPRIEVGCRGPKAGARVRLQRTA